MKMTRGSGDCANINENTKKVNDDGSDDDNNDNDDDEGDNYYGDD